MLVALPTIGRSYKRRGARRGAPGGAAVAGSIAGSRFGRRVLMTALGVVGALVLVGAGAAGAAAQRDVCVSTGGIERVQTGASECESGRGSIAVAVGDSVAI